MINFSSYIMHLSEEKADPKNFGSLDKNSKGVLHELMVGYHLYGGKHMEKHRDINGMSPKEVHDELTKKMSKEQYDNFSARAKKASEDILKHHNMSAEDVGNVQWTSKPGDIKRATNIESSQSEDDSDVILTHKNGTHHGLSLKVSDDSKPITLSNNGAKTTFGGDKIFDDHKKGITDSYPEMLNLKNNPKVKEAAVQRILKKNAAKGKMLDPENVKVGADDLRKSWLETTPGVKDDLKKRTTGMLNSVVDNMHNELQKLSPQELADHVRNTVLHAYKTPKEEQGHTHIRHFTGGGMNPIMESKVPGKDYEHFLHKPENIRATRSGASIYYHYHDEKTGEKFPFAMQTAKVGSRSDPLSNVVMIGKDVERKQDANIKAKLKENFKTKSKPLQLDQPKPDISPEKPITRPSISTRPASVRNPGNWTQNSPARVIRQSSHDPIEQSATASHGGMSFHSQNEQEHIRGSV